MISLTRCSDKREIFADDVLGDCLRLHEYHFLLFLPSRAFVLLWEIMKLSGEVVGCEIALGNRNTQLILAFVFIHYVQILLYQNWAFFL